jgi:hypothetical protein
MFVCDTHPVEALRQQLADVVGGIDLTLLLPSDAVRLVEEGTQIERLGAALKTLAAAHVAKSQAWKAQGDRTAEEWLARTTGTSTSDAAAVVRTGQQLAELPTTAAAARRGELSPAQVRELAAAATADPGAEQRLLQQAERGSLGELRDACRRTLAAADPDPEATRARIHRARNLRTWTDADGTARLSASGPADVVGRMVAAIDHQADRVFRERRAEGSCEPLEAYRFDALEALVCREAGDGRPMPRGADAKIIVRIDHAALMRGRVVDDEVCEIAGVGPVTVSVVRSWMSDAFVAAILTKGTDICSVVHLGRKFTALQQTALQWRDPECVVLGCNRTARLEKDHRDDWAHTHETTIQSADQYCHPHHLQKTRGWHLEAGVGKRRLLPPDHGALDRAIEQVRMRLDGGGPP